MNRNLTTITIAGVNFYAPSEVNALLNSLESKLHEAGLDDDSRKQIAIKYIEEHRKDYRRNVNVSLGDEQCPAMDQTTHNAYCCRFTKGHPGKHQRVQGRSEF